MAKFGFAYLPDSFYGQEYRLSRAQEFTEMSLYSIIAFSLPFLLGHEQLFVGSAVNCALVLAALNLRGARLLPVILLPSIGAFLAGYIFGASSAALLYMIPAIWLGNLVLVLAVKEIALARRKSRLLALGAGSVAKAALLFAAAFALLSLSLVPAAFLTAMGALQLATALAGGAAALAIQEGKKRFVAG